MASDGCLYTAARCRLGCQRTVDAGTKASADAAIVRVGSLAVSGRSGEDSSVEVPKTRTQKLLMESCDLPPAGMVNAMAVEELRRA
jgi:hypothetical protein